MTKVHPERRAIANQIRERLGLPTGFGASPNLGQPTFGQPIFGQTAPTFGETKVTPFLPYNGPTGGAAKIEESKYNVDYIPGQRVFNVIQDLDTRIDNLNNNLKELNKAAVSVNKSQVLESLKSLKQIIEVIEKFYPLAKNIDLHNKKNWTKKTDTLSYWIEKVINKLPQIINNTNRIVEKYAYYHKDRVKSVSKLQSDIIEIEKLIDDDIKTKIKLITKILATVKYLIDKIIDNINYRRNPDLEDEIDPRYVKRPKMSEENEAIYDYALENPYDPDDVETLENIIKGKEGFKDYAYDDEHPNKLLKPGDKVDGYVTIGYGFRFINGKEVKPGMRMTREEADEYLHKLVVDKYGKDLSKSVNVPITQNQYDALLSLVYNIGSSNLNERTIIKLLNSGDYIGAKNAFMLYIKSNGKTNKDLINRRQWEQKLFINQIEDLFN